MASVVKLQLMYANDEKIQAEIDLVESKKYADSVFISDDRSNFIAPELVETIKRRS